MQAEEDAALREADLRRSMHAQIEQARRERDGERLVVNTLEVSTALLLRLTPRAWRPAPHATI